MVALRTDRPIWMPHPGAQTAFLSSPAFEALFGGAAGPGKTDCLLMEALRQIDHPRYNGVLFRRTFPMLDAADGLIARSKRWYPAFRGRYNDQKHMWQFPSGARIYFTHLQYEDDVQNHQGAQYAYIAFDELTQFTEKQYLYLFSRCRADADSGLRCYIRSATNPGGIGHAWVKNRFITADVREKVRYFARIGGIDTQVDRFHPDGRSRSFIPATHKDNPQITQEYIANLRQLDDVERARLEGGDWDAEYTEGRVYPNWSSLENVTESAEYQPGLTIWWGVDDGYAQGQGPGTASYHPRVVLLGQVTPIGGLNIFDEYYVVNESSYETTIDNVIAKGHPTPEVAHVDSSAAMFKGAIWNRGIQTIGATHAVAEGIKNLRRMICDNNGVRLLHVHPRCKNLIREMGVYSQDSNTRFPDTGEPKPLKIDDHGPDALRYMAWLLRYRKGA